MKKILLLAFALFSIVLVQAQSQYNMQPVPSSSNFTADDFDTHADAVLEYSGNSPVVLRWNITNVNMPKEWVPYTCLGANCYIPGQMTGLHTIQPNENMPVQAHILPNGTCLNGSYDITLTDTVTNIQVASGTFNFLCGVSSVNNPVGSIKAGTIYPNPAITWFSVGDVSNAGRVELFNIIGKQVAQFVYQSSGRYDISSLPGGMYLVRILDNNGKLITTKRMSKNTP